MKNRIGWVMAVALAASPALAAPPPRLEVTSPAFRANEDIPTEYTCEGANTPPPLAWSQVPGDTKSIAVMVDDPDAPMGVFTHWIVTGISPQATSLDKAPPDARYTGPCPPSGRHHYRFRVYALDTTIARPANRAAFLAAIRGHVLAEGELVGRYEKHK